MNNTVLILQDAYGSEIRVLVDQIVSYYSEGGYTLLTLSSQEIYVLNTVDEIDQLLIESYFMIKRI